ncbi:MAG: transporter substrate-binding domain-containing protein [Paludibacteraceae bacterium]|nr:transporter substrate-binding domain-containing protein [Paludibacteraceae bacterium]
MRKIRNRQILPLSALLLVLMAICAVCSNQKKTEPLCDYPDIYGKRNLVVVMEYTPASYMRVGDSIVGEQYRLVQALSERLNIPVEIRLENDLQKSIEGLQNGQYDLVARLLPVTTEMREQVSLTEPFSTDRLVLVQRVKGDTTLGSYLSDEGKFVRRVKGDTTPVYVSSLLELPGKVICVTENSPCMQRLVNLAQEIAADEFIVWKIPDYNEEQLAVLVANGEVDYVVCDYETASRCAKNHRNLDISLNISFSQLQAWAVRKESPILLDSVNVWVKTLKKKKKR